MKIKYVWRSLDRDGMLKNLPRCDWQTFETKQLAHFWFANYIKENRYNLQYTLLEIYELD